MKGLTIRYTKHVAKEKQQQRTKLENQLKKLERNVNVDDNLSKYSSVKNALELIYDRIPEGIRIRSKCDWYKH